jgi:hypothetical protein
MGNEQGLGMYMQGKSFKRDCIEVLSLTCCMYCRKCEQ